MEYRLYARGHTVRAWDIVLTAYTGAWLAGSGRALRFGSGVGRGARSAGRRSRAPSRSRWLLVVGGTRRPFAVVCRVFDGHESTERPRHPTRLEATGGLRNRRWSRVSGRGGIPTRRVGRKDDEPQGSKPYKPRRAVLLPEPVGRRDDRSVVQSGPVRCYFRGHSEAKVSSSRHERLRGG